jgi:hypothetical protein
MGQCSVRCPSDKVLICSAACHFEDEVSTIGSFKYLPFKLSEMVSSLARFGALCAFVLPSVSAQSGGSTRQLLTNVTVFDPPDNYTVPRTLYARVRKLDCDGSNTLLATWENYLPTENNTAPCPDNCPLNPYIPIWESTDLGATWSERSRVYDKQNGWGLRYQPDLYEMTGNYSAGTLLVAANSIPADLSETKIDVYASTDKG